MTTFVYRKGKVVKKGSARDVDGTDAPYVISDHMDQLQHMATGRFHESKSEFRKDTKRSGCVELGNDPVLTRPRAYIPLDRRQRREDIKRSLYEARNR
jgi:hypothetical protein